MEETMKYGVLMHKTTMNLGDDIQSYASAQFLPHIDYIVDRENLDSFRSEGNEPVGVIMSAWWMLHKWNWPPVECIYPKLTSMHMNNYDILRKGSPIQDEWLESIGGDFFRAYGPIGCRDQTTLDFFRERGFDCYFSGCITLTLPKQKKTEDAGTYVCLVDLRPALEEAVREWLKDSGLEIRVMTHNCNYRKSDATMEERFARVEETLTQYQNAKFVVTRRLHVSLPCLAMGVPVLSVVNMDSVGNTSRWSPYYDWVHNITDKDLIAGNIDYDYNNPLPNKQDYLPTREALIRDIQQFIDDTKDCDLPVEQLKKTSYTEEEARRWQNDLMHWTLATWRRQSYAVAKELNKYKKQAQRLEKRLKKANGGILPEEAARIKQLEKQLDNVTFKDWITAYKKRHFK
jgi:hypothetical protein